jgi:transcriptional regulator with GAF, ATPase, and Fis domain
MLAEASRDAAAVLLRRAMEGRRQDPAAVAQDLGLTARALARALREHGISLEDE